MSLPLLLIPTIVVIAVIAVAPETFRSDWPVDIQRHMPEPTPVSRRRAIVGGMIFMSVLFGVVVLSSFLFATTVSSGFWWLFLSTTLTCFTFAVLDVVVVDWLVICWWQPWWILIPGTEHCAGWKDYRFHLQVMAQPKVIVVNLLIPLVITAIVWLVVGL